MTVEEVRQRSASRFERRCSQWQEAQAHAHDADNPRAAFIRRLQNGWKRKPGEPEAIVSEDQTTFADATLGEGIAHIQAMRKARREKDDEDLRPAWIEQLSNLWREQR